MKRAACLLVSLFLAASLAGCSAFGPAKAKGDSGDKKEGQGAVVQNTGPAAGGGDNAGRKDSGETGKGRDPAGGQSPGQAQVKRDSGRYVGQIDSNFIEIKISGVPDSIAARSFMLGDRIKEEFGRYGLKKDDEVSFSYVVNSNKQNVILEIKKIGPGAK